MEQKNISVQTKMMYHRWTWVEILFTFSRRPTAALKLCWPRVSNSQVQPQLSSSYGNWICSGPFEFHSIAHMVFIVMLMLHSRLLCSFVDWQTQVVACKQCLWCNSIIKKCHLVMWGSSWIQVHLLCTHQHGFFDHGCLCLCTCSPVLLPSACATAAPSLSDRQPHTSPARVSTCHSCGLVAGHRPALPCLCWLWFGADHGWLTVL